MPVRAYEYVPVPNYITVVGPLFSLLIHHAKIKVVVITTCITARASRRSDTFTIIHSLYLLPECAHAQYDTSLLHVTRHLYTLLPVM